MTNDDKNRRNTEKRADRKGGRQNRVRQPHSRAGQFLGASRALTPVRRSRRVVSTTTAAAGLSARTNRLRARPFGATRITRMASVINVAWISRTIWSRSVDEVSDNAVSDNAAYSCLSAGGGKARADTPVCALPSLRGGSHLQMLLTTATRPRESDRERKREPTAARCQTAARATVPVITAGRARS